MSTAKIVRLRQVNRLREVVNKGDQGYRFIDRDPIIDDLIYVMDNSEMTDAQIAARAMCSWQTVHNVRVKTKRPQNYTCERIIKVCGYKRVLMTKDGKVVRAKR